MAYFRAMANDSNSVDPRPALCSNGPLHLGHILETLQTVLGSLPKLRGQECFTPLSNATHSRPHVQGAIRGNHAERPDRSSHIEPHRDLADMLIAMDNFGFTHSSEQGSMRSDVLDATGNAGTSTSAAFASHDKSAKMFLPDRYVKGHLPRGARPIRTGTPRDCGIRYTPRRSQVRFPWVMHRSCWRDSNIFLHAQCIRAAV